MERGEEKCLKYISLERPKRFTSKLIPKQLDYLTIVLEIWSSPLYLDQISNA